eukprot:TRINITY_DN1537_c0_g1_i4.p1 TRINITY_DN1537_c0_g1~~TRINITY_DN1537_c0_g1_i4.p1  ORF type:complete len:458 (+),score=95.43 TRINITY_DN1537_c0_g1_i4:3-1376(+)
MAEAATASDAQDSPSSSRMKKKFATIDSSIKSFSRGRSAQTLPIQSTDSSDPSLTQNGSLGYFSAESAPEVKVALDPKHLELVFRGCRGMASEAEMQRLYEFLFSIPPETSRVYQEHARDMIERQAVALMGGTGGSSMRLKAKSQSYFPRISLEEYAIDFGLQGELFPLSTTLTHNIRVKNRGTHKATIRLIKPESTKHITYDLETAEAVVFKPNSTSGPSVVSFPLGVTVRTTLDLKFVVTVMVDESLRLFVTCNTRSALAMFGVRLSMLPHVEDTNGYTVPAVLATLRHYLLTHDAHLQEGVFRLAGDDTETKAIKAALNKTGEMTQCLDLNCVPGLIKIWFREYPEPFLNAIPLSDFMLCESEYQCVQLYQTLSAETRNILDWLFDLLTDVALHEATNRMSCKNLAIIVSPNLFQTPEDDNPLESLMASQKVVGFVCMVLMYKLREKRQRLQSD